MAHILLVSSATKSNIHGNILSTLENAGHSVKPSDFDGFRGSIELLASFGGKLDAVLFLEDEKAKAPISSASISAKTIRNLSENISFQGIRARSLPIFGVVQTTSDGNWENIKWSSARSIADVKTSNSWSDQFNRLLIDWRKEIFDELQYVGFTITKDSRGKINLNKTLLRSQRESSILTNSATPGSLRAGQYLILPDDIALKARKLDEFKHLLQFYEDIAKKERIKPESVFQRFFEANQEYIKRDRFEEAFPKPTLELPGENHAYSPDFVQKPLVMGSVGNKWEILDLKLPNDKLIVSKRFHPDLSSKLHKAIRQVRNYRRSFSSPEAEEVFR